MQTTVIPGTMPGMVMPTVISQPYPTAYPAPGYPGYPGSPVVVIRDGHHHGGHYKHHHYKHHHHHGHHHW